jgi:hypothetical protein
MAALNIAKDCKLLAPNGTPSSPLKERMVFKVQVVIYSYKSTAEHE